MSRLSSPGILAVTAQTTFTYLIRKPTLAPTLHLTTFNLQLTTYKFCYNEKLVLKQKAHTEDPSIVTLLGKLDKKVSNVTLNSTNVFHR